MSSDKAKEFETQPLNASPAFAQQPGDYPPQVGYPQGYPAYPQQPGYPQQPLYPQQPGFSQPGVPTQTVYPGQPGYPQQPGVPQPQYPVQPPPDYSQQETAVRQVTLYNKSFLNYVWAAAFACFVTCCCGWICGIVGIILAFCSHYKENQRKEGTARSLLKASFICSFIGLLTGIVGLIIFGIVYSDPNNRRCLENPRLHGC